MSKNICVYRHLKKDNGDTFYIGIGNNKRPYLKKDRNDFWYKTINKHGYVIEILYDNLSWEDACELEILLISLYGRRDLGTGCLVNMTNGGEGVKGLICSKETRLKLSKKAKLREISKETRSLMSKSMKGRKGTNNKTLLDLSTGIFFYSVKEAANALGIDRTTLADYIRGKRKNKTNLVAV